MQDASATLNALITRMKTEFQHLSESDASEPLKPGGWSRKQVIGHLIDSASNNHQRFLRLLLERELTFPCYDQAAWVESQAYQSRPWSELLWLWTAFNAHLAHVVANVPEAALSRRCRIGANDPITFAELIRDYVRHLEHHVESL